jgi:membrane protease YdiL (CAAX protease family)
MAALGAVLVLIWAHLSRTPWRSLGFARPRSWTRIFAIGIPFGIALKLVMKAIVMPLFGAPAINPHYHDLAGNAAALPLMLAAVILGAGFGEETLFRGFLFERLGKLLGTDRAALVATVLLTSGLFALAHYHDQGVPGVEQAAVTGVVFGTIYALEGRIWLPMVTHAVFDITAVALITGSGSRPWRTCSFGRSQDALHNFSSWTWAPAQSSRSQAVCRSPRSQSRRCASIVRPSITSFGRSGLRIGSSIPWLADPLWGWSSLPQS